MEGLDQMRNLSLKQCIHITAKRYAREREERGRKKECEEEGGEIFWGIAKMEHEHGLTCRVQVIKY